ncbi:adenosine receptor A2b-like [Diadema antillarum]|uniref:adenosine receptor A2b-like n=1 Tax=Diadema antillarum TaxID=105358 RepID=UPI003A86A534
MTSLAIPSSVGIVIGNAVVLRSIYRNPSLHTPTYLILASLAVSDFLTGLVAIPLQIYFNFLAPNLPCKVLTVALISVWLNILSTASFLHIVAVTVDRVVAISRPLRYLALVTMNRTLGMIASLWIVTIIFFIIRAYVMVTQNELLFSVRCLGGSYSNPQSAMVNWTILGLFGALCVALVISNVRILQISVRQSRVIADRRLAFDDAAVTRETHDDRLKAVKTISLIVGIFLVCWLPALVYVLVQLTTKITPTVHLVITETMLVMYIPITCDRGRFETLRTDYGAQGEE